jgi:hypothetical protein
VTKAHAWQREGIPQTRMLATFRAWCMSYRVRPLQARALSPVVLLSRRTGAESERVYEGVDVNMPNVGQRVLRPAPRRRAQL